MLRGLLDNGAFDAQDSSLELRIRARSLGLWEESDRSGENIRMDAKVSEKARPREAKRTQAGKAVKNLRPRLLGQDGVPCLAAPPLGVQVLRMRRR